RVFKSKYLDIINVISELDIDSAVDNKVLLSLCHNEPAKITMADSKLSSRCPTLQKLANTTNSRGLLHA
ncbi:MAG: hypothetical protein AAFQ76_10615, partial [Cyanobacteria bacterium J06626_26]